MTDRVYPTSKPATKETSPLNATNGGTTTVNNPFPANKAQLRPRYRPQPPPRRRRSCCCRCCLWTTFIIITILLLVAIAGVIFWAVFRPQKPTFSVSNLQLSQFNLTSTSVISRFNFTVSARNPNARITYFYDPFSISIYSNDVNIGDGSFKNFVHGSKNTTVLKTVVASSGENLESIDIATLRGDIKNKKSLPLKIMLETKVKAKIGSLKTKRMRIRVTCEGGHVAVPTGKTPTTAKASGIKCEVDPRIKILAWTF
ncbi:hypothetical protein Leryth_003138 [Lithospermum erythrorhizon]|nr:hypothetical protein Leryth_003138 [Lithospermum erythrorhizon]